MPGARSLSSTTSTDTFNTNANAACPQCGAAFHCGYKDETPTKEASDAGLSCWCMDLPSVLPVPSGPSADDAAAGGGGCMCPRCLAARVAVATAIPGTGGGQANGGTPETK